MCLSGAICLSVDYYFSEIEVWQYNSACWSSIIQRSSSHKNITCSSHDNAERFYNSACWSSIIQRSSSHKNITCFSNDNAERFYNSACWFSIIQRSSSHKNITCSSHDNAERLSLGVKQQSLNSLNSLNHIFG